MNSNITKTATSNPRTLLFKLRFWMSQKIFLLILLITAFILFFAFKFTYSQRDIVTYIFNIIIHSLAIWGVYITIIILAEIEVENAIIQLIERRGMNYLQEINKQKGKKRRNINRLSKDFIPNNPTQPPLAMIRLFRRICKEAKDRKFESSIYLIQPYREESIEKINEIINIQKLALRLGILGTFIGLILAISQLANFQFNNFDNEGFEDIISILFGNLFTAFSTSIAGLEVSILLGVLLMVLRNKQKVYFQNMEDTVITMLSVARNSINNDDFLSEFKQVTHIVSELDKKIYDHASRISTAVKDVENKIHYQTDEIQEGLDELVKAKNEFDSFLEQLSEIQKKFIDETKNVYNTISIKNIDNHVRNSIIQAGDNISKKIEATEETIDSQTRSIQLGMNRLAKTQLEFSQFLDAISDSQQNFINDVRNAHDIVSIKQMSQELQSSINQTGDNIARGLKINSESLSKTILELQQSLDRHSHLMQRVSLQIQQSQKKSPLQKIRDLFR